MMESLHVFTQDIVGAYGYHTCGTKVTALHNPNFQRLYKFTHFNAIQTQVFHTCYHTDYNVLLGAPTGSGKTIVAELTMFRLFTQSPEEKVVVEKGPCSNTFKLGSVTARAPFA